MKKAMVFLLCLFFTFSLYGLESEAISYNYDYWHNVVPSAEGLSHKETYYGKDILFGGEKGTIYQGTQNDGTAYSTRDSVWIRKPTVNSPLVDWDINQWTFHDRNYEGGLLNHTMATQKEVIRPQVKIELNLPIGESLGKFKVASISEMESFLEKKVGILERYPEYLQNYLNDYKENIISTINDASAESEIEETVYEEKLFIESVSPILTKMPTSREELIQEATTALEVFASKYTYSHQNQAKVDGFVTEGELALNLSPDISHCLKTYFEMERKISDIFILVDVVASDLFISEYGQSAPNNNYIELYNGTGSTIDLSQYALTLYLDSLFDDVIGDRFVQLSGELLPGETYLIATHGARIELITQANLLSAVCDFDGNDAIALLYLDKEKYKVIDLFGRLTSVLPLNAGYTEQTICFEDLKIYNNEIYLLDGKHLLKEKVVINGVEVTVQGRSQIIIINKEMKWKKVVSEFEITDYVKEKLANFYRFTTPLHEITPDKVTTTDLTKKAPFVPYSLDSSKAAIYLSGAKGIMVTKAGIYVADTGNSRVVKMNFDFVVEEVYLTPDDPTFYQYDGKESLSETLRTVYKPEKLTVNKNNQVYVIAQGVYEGIMEYSPNGKFNRFLGKNEVIANPLKIFWAKIFSDEQLAAIELDLPPEFTNITIDQAGFLYTTSKPDPDDPTASKMIKAINTSGKDVLKRNGYVRPDGDAIYVISTSVKGAPVGPTIFSAICVNAMGNYSAVDSKRGRIFTYDSEGNLLYISGEKGQLQNSINDPVAIAYFNPEENNDYSEIVLILDRASNSIIAYATTTFGALVNQATRLYLDNEIEEAESYWREVIKMNSNYELGYIGIGKSLLRKGEYEEAMRYFKLGHSSKYYSKAFQLYRDQFIKNNFNTIMAILLFLIGTYLTIYFLRKRSMGKKDE